MVGTMTEHSWIKVHSGLSDDPKHREQMGVRVWFFMWLAKHADWDTGIVQNYTDKWAADEMNMSERTIERWRQDLAGENYIICHQGYQCQHIRIMRWRNPRLVNPPQINIPGDLSSYADLRTHPRSKLRTPTLDSHSESHCISPTPEGEYLSLFGFTVSAMDQTILDDLKLKFDIDLIVSGIQEIHRRGVSSIKYLAKMLLGGWPDNDKPVDEAAADYERTRLAQMDEAAEKGYAINSPEQRTFGPEKLPYMDGANG